MTCQIKVVMTDTYPYDDIWIIYILILLMSNKFYKIKRPMAEKNFNMKLFEFINYYNNEIIFTLAMWR